MQVIVDTSAWSLALRRNAPVSASAKASSARQSAQQTEQERCAQSLKDLINDGRAILIGPVRQELLSGMKSLAQFTRLREALEPFPDLPITQASYEWAAQLFNQCQAKGVQGSHIDFLICVIALQYDRPIMTVDKDFWQFQKHVQIKLHEF